MEKKITAISIGPDGTIIPKLEEDKVRESEQEDFGPGSRTKKENDERNLYPSEVEHPTTPELNNLTEEENAKFKEEWYQFLLNRKKEDEK